MRRRPELADANCFWFFPPTHRYAGSVREELRFTDLCGERPEEVRCRFHGSDLRRLYPFELTFDDLPPRSVQDLFERWRKLFDVPAKFVRRALRASRHPTFVWWGWRSACLVVGWAMDDGLGLQEARDYARLIFEGAAAVQGRVYGVSRTDAALEAAGGAVFGNIYRARDYAAVVRAAIELVPVAVPWREALRKAAIRHFKERGKTEFAALVRAGWPVK